MFQKLKQVFASPIFIDEDETRIAGLLNIITKAIFGGLFIVILISPFSFREPIYGIVISVVTALPTLCVWVLVRKGHVRLASHLFVFGLFLLDTILIYITGGLHSGVLAGFVAVVVLGGLLLERRSAVTLIVIIALIGLTLVIAEFYGFLPAPVIFLDDLARWLSLMMNIALAATVLDLATSGVKSALARAQRGEAALAETNVELKKEISERIKTADELRQLKEFNENIVQSVAETIIIEDKNGILTFANPRTEMLLGYSPEELIGKHWAIIVPKEQFEIVRMESNKRPEGIESQYEINLLKKDGSQIPVIASARPLFQKSQFIGVISTFTEITNLKQVEKELRDIHQQLNTTLNALPDLMFEVDVEGQILNYHAPENDLLVTSPENFLGRSVEDVFPEEPAKAIMKVVKEAIDQERHNGTTYSLETSLGQHWFELSMAAKGNPSEPGKSVVILVRDSTERKLAEEALKESEEKYRSLVENLNVGVYRSTGGENEVFIHANTAIIKMFGYDQLYEFMEIPFENFYESTTDRERFVSDVIEHGYVKNRELRLIKKDGSSFWASCTSTAQFDNDGRLKWIDGVIEDITIRKRAEEQLLYDAFHDALTELPNRALFYDRLSTTLARALRHDHYNYAVLFLDLDRFKLVNDSLGHNAGDQLLVLVANRLSSFLRTVDTIARLGGDEFVILIDDINDIGEAVAIANRVQRELKLPFQIDGHEVYTSASIGIVFDSDGYRSPEDILRDADTAMYRAKRLGKERYELFDPGMRQDVIERMRVETDLRRAFELGELRLYYQPMVSIDADIVVGFEALLRWQHPKQGMILPKDFIGVAEETGMIVPIGQWIFQEAGKVIAHLRNRFPQDPPLFVSVNLSRRQFTDPGLITDIEMFLGGDNLDPSCLILEITEDVVMEDSEQETNKINQILNLGIKIHMDDFGTGYSSLATLQRYPIDALKIAREFITDVDTNQDRSEVVHTIITLARIMNIHVIAEGVENKQQLDYLRKENCDIWQGNFCSKALSPVSLEKFLLGRRGTL